MVKSEFEYNLESSRELPEWMRAIVEIASDNWQPTIAKLKDKGFKGDISPRDNYPENSPTKKRG